MLYSALQPKLAPNNLRKYAFLKSHNNCDEYMGLQKERKSTFFTAFEHGEKEAFDIAVVSEYLCHLKTQYLAQSRNLCSG